MTNKSSQTSQSKSHIREWMVLKDTEELLQIFTAHDTNDWVPEAFEVIQEILAERGVSVEPSTDYLSDPQPDFYDEDPLDEETIPLDFSRINWQTDSVEVVYREMSKQTINLQSGLDSNGRETPLAQNDIDDTSFYCINCDNEISWHNQTCPVCGLELYLEDNLSESANDVDADLEEDETEIEEFAQDLRQMSMDELSELWYESDPMSWDRTELTAIRRIFFENDLCLPFLLDAPQDLVQRLPYLTEESLSLRGFAGYRNRPGRSGLDYIDTSAEYGRMWGLFIRAAFIQKLKTKNWFIILIMYSFSILLSFPAIYFFTQGINYNYSFVFFILSFLIAGPGIFVFIYAVYNSIRSLTDFFQIKRDSHE